MKFGEPKTQDATVFVPSFFHGTKADLKIGDLIQPQFLSNYGQQAKANFVYFTGTLDASIWGAELALGNLPERIYVVEPTGPYEDDPNLTNQKFPGNPTLSFRSIHPVKIIAELKSWTSHDPFTVEKMKTHLQQLNQDGIEAINE